MTKEIAGLNMADELPPATKWRSLASNMLEPIPFGDSSDADIVFDKGYREQVKDAFMDEGVKFGRGSNFGPHIRLVLPMGGEVRDYGHCIACETGSDAEAAVAVKLAKIKGWKQLKINGAEDFRRAVWFEALRSGCKPQDIKGYEPTTMDLNLARDLSLAPAPRPRLEIIHGHDGRNDSANGSAAQTALRPTWRKL